MTHTDHAEIFNRPGITSPDNPGDSPLMQWIHDHRDFDRDYCLIWPFSRKQDGYGQVGRGGKQITVHRIMCELRHGPAPSPEHQAAHSCGRGHDGCVNPRHLSWKTPSENQLDREAKIRRTKLTEEAVAQIRDLEGKEHVTVTAARFGVREATIRQIRKGLIWRADKKFGDLPDDTVRIIKAAQGKRPCKTLAREVGASPSVIRNIWNGRTYKHVTLTSDQPPETKP